MPLYSNQLTLAPAENDVPNGYLTMPSRSRTIRLLCHAPGRCINM